MDEANDQGIPTAVIRHHQSDPQAPFFRLNAEMWQLHPGVAERPRGILIDKQLPGSFTGTGLDDWLRHVGADTVTIVGYMTHMCCDKTARQAMHRGYSLEFLSDATGTLSVENSAGKVSAEQMHQSILVAQQMMISRVTSSEEWMTEVRHR